MPTPEEVLKARAEAEAATQAAREDEESRSNARLMQALVAEFSETFPALLKAEEDRNFPDAKLIHPKVEQIIERRGIFGNRKHVSTLRYDRAAWKISHRSYPYLDANLEQLRWIGVDGLVYAEPRVNEANWTCLPPGDTDIETVRELVELTRKKIRLYRLQDSNKTLEAAIASALGKTVEHIAANLTAEANSLADEVFLRTREFGWTAAREGYDLANERGASYFSSVGLSDFSHGYLLTESIGVLPYERVDQASAPWLALRLHIGQSWLLNAPPDSSLP